MVTALRNATSINCNVLLAVALSVDKLALKDDALFHIRQIEF